jgi:hypothetical protein
VIKDRRIGEFAIQADLVNDRPDVVRMMLRDVIVLMAEHQPWSDRFMYIGIHPSFKDCPIEEIPPRYMAVVSDRVSDLGDGQVERVCESVTWEKTP